MSECVIATGHDSNHDQADSLLKNKECTYADRAWHNAARLAETELGDPPNLWETIGNLAESAWIARRKKYLWLHTLTAAHMRVWRIGCGIRDKYAGDVRRLWRGQSPEDVRDRLNELRLGPQLSRMTIGALIDTGHLTGSGDLKADLHVRRVLGRLLRGSTLSPDEATKVARLMHPMKPWRLDSALYWHGKNICRATPRCNNCPLRKECRSFNGKRAVT